ncbi:hypothetical protein FF38_06038 [Lucilia cuprina]|uniref:LNS2/PITP domain-containing protein n=1 Tax=Lucilia cuprina TaxID=7375 RepID=A0A0L0BXK3_LUCCU|nr:hypothetical protein FF38_06038 [Lucilia cuprina]
MACLRDIAKLYEYDYDKDSTPFYAGFGNRMTDAVSYRSVGVPPTKIFTINSVSEVKMELLELTGVKSSYILITDLVDQLFPPVGPGQNKMLQLNSVGFSDANFWKPPLPELSDEESDEEDIKHLKPSNHTMKRRTSTMNWDRNLNATLNELGSDFDVDLDSDETEGDLYGEEDDDQDFDADEDSLIRSILEANKRADDFNIACAIALVGEAPYTIDESLLALGLGP